MDSINTFMKQLSTLRKNLLEIRLIFKKAVYMMCKTNSLSSWVIYSEGQYFGVMVIVVGNGHGDTSSNPERDILHFT